MDRSRYHLLLETFDRHLARRRLFPTSDERDDALHSAIACFLESGPDDPSLTTRRTLAWLMTTARRILLRGKRRERYLFVEIKAAEEPHNRLFSTDHADHSTMWWTVGTLLNGLSEPHRTVMALRLEGLSRSDIAEQLGLQKETVNKRLARAGARLRAKLMVDTLAREEAQWWQRTQP